MGAPAAEDVARALRALADPLRLRALSLITASPSGEACVLDISELTAVSQPTVSHHLKVLRDAGIVTSERRGTWVWYRLAPEHQRGGPRSAGGVRRRRRRGRPARSPTSTAHLDRVAADLAPRYPTIDAARVRDVVRDSATALARTSGLGAPLVNLTERFARQRLDDLVPDRGRHHGPAGPVRLRRQRRPLAAGGRPAPALRRGRGPGPVGRVGAGPRDPHPRPAGARRARRRRVPQAAHRRRRPRRRRRRDDGLRRRLPGLPRHPLRGLGGRRPRARVPRGRRGDPRRHRHPRPDTCSPHSTSSEHHDQAQRPVRLRPQRRPLPDGRGVPHRAVRRRRRGPVGGFDAGRPGQPGRRRRHGRGRRRHPRRAAEGAHHRGRAGVRRGGDHGLRRRVPVLPRQALRGLGARGPGRPGHRLRAPDPRRDPRPDPHPARRAGRGARRRRDRPRPSPRRHGRGRRRARRHARRRGVRRVRARGAGGGRGPADRARDRRGGRVLQRDVVGAARGAVPASPAARTSTRGRRLGPFWGFQAGWSFVVGKTASCAAMALTFATYAAPGHTPARRDPRGRRRHRAELPRRPAVGPGQPRDRRRSRW